MNFFQTEKIHHDLVRVQTQATCVTGKCFIHCTVPPRAGYNFETFAHQFFAGLEVTGSFDEATIELLKRPRCGVPDVSHAGYRNKRSVSFDEDSAFATTSFQIGERKVFARVKRYSLQGERWSHTNLTWNLKPLPPLPNSPDFLDKDLIRRELGYALDLWAR